MRLHFAVPFQRRSFTTIRSSTTSHRRFSELSFNPPNLDSKDKLLVEVQEPVKVKYTVMHPQEPHLSSATKNEMVAAVTLLLYVAGLTTAAERNSANVSPSISMLSRDQTYHVTSGGKLSLDCEFHMEAFMVFENPTIWEKIQREERTRINMAGVVQEPFAATRRFDIEFFNKPPRYRMRLSVRDTSAEDSGNYTCEVRGRKSRVLGKVTHTVHVRGSLTSLFLTSDLTPTNLSRPLTNLTAKDGHPISLSCVTRGPCPSADLTLQTGDTDLTPLFHRSHPIVMVTGVEGLRVMECTAWRSTGALVLGQHHDGKYLRCVVAQRQGMEGNATQIRLYVHYAPRIRCKPSLAQLGDRDVYIECSVWSRPELIVLYWVIDANGTTVSSDEVINEYWTMVTVKEEGHLVTKLFTRIVKSDTFRKYTLFSENAFGTTSYNAELVPASRHHLSSSSSPKRTLLEDGSHNLERSRSSSSSSSHERKSGNRTPSANAVSNRSSHSTLSTPITLLTFILVLASVLHSLLMSFAPFECTLTTPLKQLYVASDRRCCCRSDRCYGDHCRRGVTCEVTVRTSGDMTVRMT